MARVATTQDYFSGKLLFYWGDYYYAHWVSDTHVCLCLPGCTPGSWKHIDPKAMFSKSTSVTLKVGDPQILVFE